VIRASGVRFVAERGVLGGMLGLPFSANRIDYIFSDPSRSELGVMSTSLCVDTSWIGGHLVEDLVGLGL
jgi:hypothetical protein